MTTSKRVILITGANNGIGFDTSYALAAADANNHVIMTARSSSKGQKAVQDIEARKPQGKVSFLELDVTSDDSIMAAAEKIAGQHDHLDVLVNNAGICLGSTPSRDSLRATFETNVFGPMLLTEALAALLQKSSDPRVINVTSSLGSIALRSDTQYGHYGIAYPEYRMSKAALNMLTTCQSYHFKDWRFKVWSYCPGFVVTDLTGSEQRQMRRDNGAESSETSAQGILEIVNGQRDSEVNQFIARYGETHPW